MIESNHVIIYLIALELILCSGLSFLIVNLIYQFKDAPKLKTNLKEEIKERTTSLTIIVPAYNEAKKIETCISSLMENKNPCSNWQVILVDDCSTDETVEIAKKLANRYKLSESRYKIISAGDRPRDEWWVGKNWACTIASEASNSEWILFVDADTELRNDTLSRAISYAIEKDLDLLSLAPKIECSCLSEWLVQPVISCLLSIGFPIKEINKDSSNKAFAAGPFMLFKRESYNKIGGHRRLAGEVVEDLALAKNIKDNGLKLNFLLGIDSIKLRMYDDLPSLWEGWSKNWFLGLDRNPLKSIGASIIVFNIFSLSIIIEPFIIYYSLINPISYALKITMILIAVMPIYLQFYLRLWVYRNFNLSMKYWWLMWVGGIIVSLIGINSTYITILGKGWTWKGRSLSERSSKN